MRTTFVVSSVAVLAFAAFVVSKSTSETYAPACPPASELAAVDAVAPIVPPENPADPTPFKRERLENYGAAELAAMPTEKLLELSDDTMMTELRGRLMAKRQRVGGIEHMGRNEQAVLRAEVFGLMLTRDGLLSLYSSPWGDYDATAAALSEVGATDMLAILQKSLVVFGGSKPPASEEERIAVLSKLLEGAEMSPFEELDQVALSIMPAYADTVAKYVRANISKLDVPPTGSVSRGQ